MISNTRALIAQFPVILEGNQADVISRGENFGRLSETETSCLEEGRLAAIAVSWRRGRDGACYINPRSFRLTQRPSPITRWSSTSIPTTFPASQRRFETLISSWLGVGSPEGWL